jgi:hypothetical protein
MIIKKNIVLSMKILVQTRSIRILNFQDNYKWINKKDEMKN